MWKEKYKIGVPMIDQQHEELFKRVSDFIRTFQCKGDWNEKLDKVNETMTFMHEYVVIHFGEEEAYMEEINYPDIINHKQAHITLKETVSDYDKTFRTQGMHEETVQEFGAKLMTWLIMHVAKTDKKIGEYVDSKGGMSNES